MAKQDPRGHALTVEGSAGNQVTNPLLRASQAMADMQRIGAQFGSTPSGRLRLSGIKPPHSAVERRADLLGANDAIREANRCD
jgi:hypothetical protein